MLSVMNNQKVGLMSVHYYMNSDRINRLIDGYRSGGIKSDGTKQHYLTHLE